MVLDGIESSRQTHLAKLLNVQCSPRLLVQVTTFYTKQGSTLMRSIGPNFKIPPAGSLLSLIGLTIFISIPIYDKILVPLARKFTGRPSGITVLQRIELFYDQVSELIRSLGAAAYVSVTGVGSFISIAIITIVQAISSRIGDHEVITLFLLVVGWVECFEFVCFCMDF
ncbi:hypothetical protein Q3G72_007871 [Acer saccharum]|nr:hypothetical protein Q3G72_007871 [Acer saccharum]